MVRISRLLPPRRLAEYDSQTMISKLFSRVAFIPSLLWNVTICRVLRIWNWWDQVDDQLYVGARPFPSDVAKLYQLGVRAVVNTCEEYEGPLEEYKKFEITQLYLPTIDFTPPTLADVQAGVDFIEQHQAQGETVYVHCKAGRGRSATIALCAMIKKYDIDPEEALRRLQAGRKQVLKSLPEREVVKEYWASISPS